MGGNKFARKVAVFVLCIVGLLVMGICMGGCNTLAGLTEGAGRDMAWVLRGFDGGFNNNHLAEEQYAGR